MEKDVWDMTMEEFLQFEDEALGGNPNAPEPTEEEKRKNKEQFYRNLNTRVDITGKTTQPNNPKAREWLDMNLEICRLETEKYRELGRGLTEEEDDEIHKEVYKKYGKVWGERGI